MKDFGHTVSFKYDPFGRRIYKSSSSGTSIFAYDGNNLIEQTNSLGTAVARYEQGLNIDQPLAMLSSATTSYYEADGLGSITSLSSGAGSLTQTYTFDSFGNRMNSSGSLTNPFQYTAREFDAETNLYYYRSRYYDPSFGRFLSEDRLGFEGGVNFYRYAQNSPVLWIDPSGSNPGDSDLCFRVTPNGMTQVPCTKTPDPCRYMPDGVLKCVVPIPPSQPAGPLHYHDTSPGCACNPEYLMIQAQNIRREGHNKNLRTIGLADLTSAGFEGLELGLEYLGLGAASEFLLPVDLVLLGLDADEVRRNNKSTEERIRLLFAPCMD